MSGLDEIGNQARKEEMMAVAVDRPTEAELPGLVALLEECGLPLDGFGGHLPILVARVEGAVVGCVALELYDRHVVLRSVAVAPPYRGRGVGTLLVSTALDKLRADGHRAVYLLAETASTFFGRLGFIPVERTAVPEGVRTSVEFTTACPKSAQAMVLTLA